MPSIALGVLIKRKRPRTAAGQGAPTCGLACTGCRKIDYLDAILNRRLSVQECLDAADECGAPMVAIPGGEPLIHREIGQTVKGLVARAETLPQCYA
jgi:MoaA/NifB/PqqE/SkfB family radical SAM enzyme